MLPYMSHIYCMSDTSPSHSYCWSVILGCVCLSVLLILCLLGADWGRTYWFLATRASSWKSPDCFCSAPRLPLFCLAPSNETPNEPAASFLSFSARSAACVVSPLVSPALAPHVFVCPPPALRADFSIHPPPPFSLTVLKPFFISCFYSTFVTLLACLVSLELFLASTFILLCSHSSFFHLCGR